MTTNGISLLVWNLSEWSSGHGRFETWASVRFCLGQHLTQPGQKVWQVLHSVEYCLQPPPPGRPRASDQGKCDLLLARGWVGGAGLPKQLASWQLGSLTSQGQSAEDDVDPQF